MTPPIFQAGHEAYVASQVGKTDVGVVWATMPRSISYTVAYERDGSVVDLCKIMFGGDGSYFVTAPYHPHNKAMAAKIIINYAHEEAVTSFSDALELAVLDDDLQRLKMGASFRHV